ncbi:MAG: winged helix-turn-helix transcriptional regulator [Candidatus Heimdallarchaeota archaeon]|nr:winged helix-turn-helix transcriptional regulator [Candidatus Heimdallarchaeota archaeon]
MSEDYSPLELHESLQRSFNELMLVLKAFGTPNRLKILITLLEGPKTFQELIDSVEIKRTALSNHIVSLKDASLVDKIHHGYYRVTQKGLEFLYAIDKAYQESQTSDALEKESEQRKQLIDTFLRRRED